MRGFKRKLDYIFTNVYDNLELRIFLWIIFKSFHATALHFLSADFYYQAYDKQLGRDVPGDTSTF